MKEIQLSKSGKVTLVDDEDFERINQYSWWAARNRDTDNYYAYATIDGQLIPLHRFIMEAPDGMEVDHRNNNPLDNTRQNLRLATHAQNCRNRGKSKNNKSGYKGVIAEKNAATFRAQIKLNNVRYHLGNFPTAVEAARAYNEAAIRMHGEFAWLNLLD